MERLPDVLPPGKPPQRIYISGHTYKLISTYAPLPAVVNAVKLVWKWASTAGRIARNIMFAQTPPAADTTDSVFLKAIANAIMTSLSTAGLGGSVGTTWSLNNVEAHDLSGASESVGVSDHAAIAGTASGTLLPPQCAVVISWHIAASYRGGKPRTYLPGIPSTALNLSYDSVLNPTYATGVQTQANNFASSFNASSPGGHDCILGTVSYHSGHAVRPTPIFRPFGEAVVHERLDSQRRRNGKESAFGVTP